MGSVSVRERDIDNVLWERLMPDGRPKESFCRRYIDAVLRILRSVLEQEV